MAIFRLRSSSITKMVILLEFLLVAYLVYSLTKNVYNSYQVDSLIAEFEAENREYELENRQKSEDYLYFTSEEYIDKIAKQNLGLVNPGEEVIVLAPDVLSAPESEQQLEGDFAIDGDASNLKRWYRLFFGSRGRT